MRKSRMQAIASCWVSLLLVSSLPEGEASELLFIRRH